MAAGQEVVVLGAAFDAVVAEGLGALPDRLRRVVELVDIDAQPCGGGGGARRGGRDGDEPAAPGRVRLRDRLASAGLAPGRGGS